MAVPLHLCFGEVVPIPPTMENPSLRSAPSAGAGAREDARSLRELNSAAGRGNLPESLPGFAGHFMPEYASEGNLGSAVLTQLKTVALEAKKSREQAFKDAKEAARQAEVEADAKETARLARLKTVALEAEKSREQAFKDAKEAARQAEVEADAKETARLARLKTVALEAEKSREQAFKDAKEAARQAEVEADAKETARLARLKTSALEEEKSREQAFNDAEKAAARARLKGKPLSKKKVLMSIIAYLKSKYGHG
uniref:RxLR effector candidate protein n=2 Tax=Hyaloperonospora arabidopsidis (strain Emoy2) TaxID=559515 RepID=M4BE53_HYAAE